MTQHQVLFCPFCRESFEGRTSCPEHELGLVPFDQVQAGAGADDDLDEPDLADDDRLIAPLDPRFGRGPVALGASLAVSALALELATLGGRALRTYALAAALPSLWTLLLVSFCAFYVLVRRRTRRALRGLRVLVPLLGAIEALTFALAAHRLGASVLREPAGYVIALSALLLVVFGLRLGVSKRA